MNGNNHGGILSGLAIQKAVASGEIHIDPWDPTHISFGDRLNPASYDLTLGPEVAVYEDWVWRYPCEPVLIEDGRNFARKDNIIDMKREPKVERFKMSESMGWILKPGIGYLMNTVERIKTDHFVPIIDGKSSIGRLFATCHISAGFGDPGFDGQYTLEVVVTHPLRIYPGMRFCQIRFHTLVGEVETYQKKGNYRGALAEGPIPSQTWKMFQKKEK